MNNPLLEIHHLTVYQAEMLDHMWSLSSQEEYFEWFELLDQQDQQLAVGLTQLLALAMIESVMAQELDQCCEAREYLRRFQLND